MYNFRVQPFFFGILGKKSLALSNILFLVGRKFLSKLVNILVGLGILDVSGQVHWVGLPIIRYIHVKYWSRVGFFGSYHHSFPTTCYFLIFNRNIFLFLTGYEKFCMKVWLQLKISLCFLLRRSSR